MRTNMDPQTVTAICSVIIAGAALFISTWQVITTRRHNRLSVRPSLNFHIIVALEPPKAEILITNNGVGPAFIKDFRVYIDDKLRDDFKAADWPKVASLIGFKSRYAEGICFGKDTPLAAAKSHPVFKVSITEENKPPQVQKAFDRINIFIKYESVYKDKYEVKLRTISNISNKADEPGEENNAVLS